MTYGTQDLPGLINRVTTTEQAIACEGPNLLTAVRAFLLPSPAPGLSPIPPAGGTGRSKLPMQVLCELIAFHQSSPLRHDPLAEFHRAQVALLKAKLALWLIRATAASLHVAKRLPARPAGTQGHGITRIAARYDLPKRSKTPRPL